jgi:hypothetical protein
MDNPEKLATLGTHDEKTKQHNTIRKTSTNNVIKA